MKHQKSVLLKDRVKEHLKSILNLVLKKDITYTEVLIYNKEQTKLKTFKIKP